jgi:hypothetical protein
LTIMPLEEQRGTRLKSLLSTAEKCTSLVG